MRLSKKQEQASKTALYHKCAELIYEQLLEPLGL